MGAGRGIRWGALHAALALLVGTAGCAGGAYGTASEHDEVIEVVEELFEAMRESDADGVLELLDPSATLRGVVVGGDRPSGPGQTAQQFAALVGGAPRGSLVERMWDPKVRIQDGVAQLWAPYDFYRNGEFSHCGVDAVHLTRESGEWRILGIAWTVAQPPACDRHPEGPPG